MIEVYELDGSPVETAFFVTEKDFSGACGTYLFATPPLAAAGDKARDGDARPGWAAEAEPPPAKRPDPKEGAAYSFAYGLELAYT